MSSFNQVILLANLTRDPQTKTLPSQTTVTEFGVAMNRKFKTQSGEEREEVTFVDVAAFGKTGELIAQYFTKGKPILLQGRLKFDSWEKDGQKRSKLSVVVDAFQFVGGRDGGGNGDGGERQPSSARPQPARQAATQPIPEAPTDFKEDDIPW